MKNHDENLTYRQQERDFVEKSRELIDLLTARGVLGDPKIKNEGVRAVKQKQAKSSYHNTMLLLQNYRTLAWLMECFPETMAEELERPFEDVDELLEQLDLTLAMGNRRIETRLEGTRKSRILLDRVNEALTVLKSKPKNGETLYKVIYLTYIAPETLKHTELLYRLGMSSRHYYRLRQQAITILSIRLWSAPTAEVDFWTDILAILENLE